MLNVPKDDGKSHYFRYIIPIRRIIAVIGMIIQPYMQVLPQYIPYIAYIINKLLYRLVKNICVDKKLAFYNHFIITRTDLTL